MTPSGQIALLDGRSPNQGELLNGLLYPYGIYTSLAVDGGRIRGLPMHIDRIRVGCEELFDLTPSEESIRQAIRSHISVAGPEISLRITAFNSSLELAAPGAGDGISLLTTSSPGVPLTPRPPDEGMDVGTEPINRFLPLLKTTDLLPQIYARRQAQARGFGDALLVAEGQVLEGTTWNIILYDIENKEAVFPDGPSLPGVTSHLMKSVIDSLGFTAVTRVVSFEDLRSADLVQASNVTFPFRYLGSCDRIPMRADIGLLATIIEAYLSLPTYLP